MPGRHQLIYAYRNFNGGTDLWCSDGWAPEGQLFCVWRTSKLIGIGHATPFWQWRPMGWRFAPPSNASWAATWAALSPVQRIYTDVNLSRAEATVWPAPVLCPDHSKGFMKGGGGRGGGRGGRGRRGGGGGGSIAM